MDQPINEDELKQFLNDRHIEKPDVLTTQQINQCLMDVEDLHPMRRSAKMDDILTFMKPFRKCRKARKPDFRYALRKTLLEEMQIRMPKSETQLNNEPFLRLGYGVNSYFDIMLSIFYMFAFISLVCLPMFYCYSQNDSQGLSELQTGFAKVLGKYSLGNMGGSTVICQSMRLKTGPTWQLECPNSKRAQIDSENVKYGLMSKNFVEKTYCTDEAIADSGELNNAENCSNKLRSSFINSLLAECKGEKTCSLDLTDPRQYINDFEPSGECGKDSFLYFQAPCLLPSADGHMDERQIFGLITACTAVFIYLFTIVYIDYIKTLQKTKYVDFDVKTITAGDYTVEFDISEAIYEEFLLNYHDHTNPIGEVQQFKLYIQLELEKRMNEFPNNGVDGPGEQDIKIAQITFAFNNSKVINWLKTRGTYIKTEKWDKVSVINQQISDGIKEEKLLNQMQRPVSVFATMETEEGYTRANQYNDHIQDVFTHYNKFLNDDVELQEASEPTDIIWENRSFTPRQRSVKRCIVYFLILVMLTISAIIIFVCTLSANAKKFRYPKVNCENIAAEYGNDPSSLEWNSDAITEYANNYPKQMKGKTTFYTGQMQCLCTHLVEETDKATVSEQKFKIIFKDSWMEDQTVPFTDPNVPMCKQYFADKTMSKILGTSIGFIIIAVNIVLKTCIIKLITWIGEDTVSEQLASITNGVFYAQFFNTGFLLLIVNANMTEHDTVFVTKYIAGRHHDYMPDWYAEVGAKIVQTMLINSILPYVGLTTGFLIPILKRALDRKFSGNPYKTKKTSMAAYKDLYSGADYVIHFKYSGVLNIVYITMMYGMGMPILFVLAAFNFFNQWVCERIIVAYQVKLPPALDDKLTINCLNMFKWAPILLLFNGYWMISNKQIYQNDYTYIGKSTDTMLSNHFAYFGVNWGTPILFMASCAVFIIAVQKIFADYLMKWGFAMASKEIKVDEDLPNFFKSVKLSQADELIHENTNMQKNFMFNLNDPDTIARLDDTKVPKKAIQGTPWYQILSNARYSHLFYYVGAFIPEREKLIEDGFAESTNKNFGEEEMAIRCEQSDMIMILLNLAFVPDSVIKSEEMNFEPGWQHYFKLRMKHFNEDFDKKVGTGCSIEYQLVEKDGKKWYQPKSEMAECDAEKISGKTHTVYFDTQFKIQDEDLETRYKKFKDFRDKELQIASPDLAYKGTIN